MSIIKVVQTAWICHSVFLNNQEAAVTVPTQTATTVAKP